MKHLVTIPFGLPGQGMHLGIDPLSSFFLLVLAPPLLARGFAGGGRTVEFWLCAVGMGVAVSAADGFALVFGLGLMSAGGWLVLQRFDARLARRYAGLAIVSTCCLIPALFMAAGSAAFALILLATAAQAGLCPCVAARAERAGSLGGGWLAGPAGNVAAYVLIRYSFIVLGGAAAPWWGALLIAGGAVCACAGALRAVLAVRLPSCLAYATSSGIGWLGVALGIGLYGRALGHPALAWLALQAALLGALAHALWQPMLWLGAGVIARVTGTTSLDWLGGLLRGMPRLGLLMLAAASGMAALPLGPGFAPVFLLLHACIAAAAAGGVLARLGFAAVLGLLGLTAGLAFAAAIRLIGIGFLGRPRSLRAAAAAEAPRAVLIGMGVLTCCMLPLALAPALAAALVQPVLATLIPRVQPVALGYAPLPIALTMTGIGGGAWLLLRRFGARGQCEAPAWNGGFDKPPAWLPFGDPATQPSATGLSAPVRLLFAPILQITAAGRLAGRWRWWSGAAWRRLGGGRRRRGPAAYAPAFAVAFTVLLLGLAALGMERGG